MKRAIGVIAVCLLSLVFATSVPCARSTGLLEVPTEGRDPCGGRVCEFQCSCGKYVFFNLESLMTQKGALDGYQAVCVTDSVNSGEWITSGRAGMMNRGKTPTGDFGEVYEELKKSLGACGYRYTEQGFGRLYKKIEGLSYHNMRGRQGARKPNPPYFLATYALKLKDFAKVCDSKANWQSSFQAELNAKLAEVQKSNAIDINSCVVSQAERMKSAFAQLILSSHQANSQVRRHFCPCAKLFDVSIPGYRNTKTYPFKSYKSTVDSECRQKCSGRSTLSDDDYVEELYFEDE